MNNLLVTGAKGFIGSHLVRELELHGSVFDDVFTFSSTEYDLTNRLSVTELLSDCPSHTILHLAGKIGNESSYVAKPASFFSDNFDTLSELLKAASNKGLKRFVHVISSDAYPKDAGVYKEKELLSGAPFEFCSNYAAAQRAASEFVHACATQFGFEACTIILPTVYGPGDHLESDLMQPVADFMYRFQDAKINQESRVTLKGNPDAFIELIYVRDAVQGILQTLNLTTLPRALNLGSSDVISFKALALLIQKVVAFDGAVLWDINQARHGERSIDSSQARELLQFAPKIGLQNGLDRMYSWYDQKTKQLDLFASR
ncbi:MAG: NAD-dependent epimerase/dehydratase family protein [Deltaproteobacteria bacterium]|nr:NAD-dependent epimerase/dehydratase family protein [Deltaproteobacteria bacterium]